VKYGVALFILFSIVLLPLAVVFVIEPLYPKMSSWLFLLIFIVLLPLIATFGATVYSNRKMGFRAGLGTVAKQRAYFNVVYYLLFISLSLVVLYLAMSYI